VWSEEGAAEEVTYSTEQGFVIRKGKPFPGSVESTAKTYPYKVVTSLMKFEWKSKLLWEAAYTNNAIQSARLKEGDSIEEKLKELQKPIYEGFYDAKFSKPIVNPAYRYGLGQSTITLTGLK
jgi:hypothetical protein